MPNQAAIAQPRVLDANGAPVAGALAYIYASGTTTLLTIYSDAGAATPRANPVEADGNGALPQFFVAQPAKAVVQTPAGATLYAIDPVPLAVQDGAAASVVSFSPTVELPYTNVQAAIEGLAGMAVPPIGPEYLGLVAGPTRICHIKHASNKQMNSRVMHRAAQDLRTIKLVYSNIYNGSASGSQPFSEASGDAFTLAASIEYPRGVITQVLFSGESTTTLASGATIVSDEISVLIPSGAAFWVRSWQNVATGTIIYSDWVGATDIDMVTNEYAASGLTNKTGGAALDPLLGPSLDVCFGPIAIIGQTTKTTALIIGDSRAQGVDDYMDWSLDVGTIGRSIGKEFAYINAARSSDRAGNMVASHALRVALANYCTHVVNQFGTNDLHSELVGTVTLETRMETINALYPTKGVYVTTLEPRNTSTDSWATLANQTVSAQEAERVAFNGLVRAGSIAGARGFFDIASAVESSFNSGKWKVTGEANGYTDDGNHANQAANELIRDLTVVNPAVLRPSIIVQPEYATIGDMRRGEAGTKFATPLSITGDKGTFDPVLFGLTSAGTGTYAVQEGRWQRIGSMVFVMIRLQWTAHTGTGSMRISGLPFDVSAEGGNSQPLSVSYYNLTHTANSTVAAVATYGTDEVALYQLQNGTGITQIPMDTAGTVLISGWYFVD